MTLTQDLILNLPEVSILLGALITLLADLFIIRHKSRYIFLCAQLVLLSTIYFLCIQLNSPVSFSFHNMLCHDSLASLLKFAIVMITLLVFLYSRNYIKQYQLPEGEFYTLCLLAVLGMMLLASANHLLIVFLGLELSSLPIYALIAIQRDSKLSTEAAMKYYLMGAVASGILLYAISFIYGLTDTLNIQNLFHLLANESHPLLMLIIVVFFLAVIGFKLGAAPFHMWTPDVYEGAPTPVTLFLSSTPKFAALAILFRLFAEMLPGYQIDWQKVLIFISITSFVIGNIAALSQTNFKRMLAYSSISHMGYILLGFIAGTSKGYASAVFYLLTYSLSTLAALGITILLAQTGHDLANIKQLKGLNSRNPMIAFVMLLVMFSMAGIPPLVGFFAKLGVLESLIQVHLTWLAALALIFSVIGSYYYLVIVKVMYFDEPEELMPLASSVDMNLVIILNGLLILGLGLVPSYLFKLCLDLFLST